ncbi:pirin family protein [Tieghemostelium lacteum]|uniref:Pirin family protein n=1 Tax=Tieghemostelium lacteum TaxID=361077 RepID=A0A151ZE50_TIELA|nr:pirin family protein [Tieghemostelium lacteum]|eukprot:KYQ92164.1 pirin family protein [Tieghemostelium lacteum]
MSGESSNSKSRIVSRVATGIDTKDGAGVKLKRVIGGSIKTLDPFLLLDEFKSDNAKDYIKGFPSHPHRGQQTVTIMIEGNMLHEDNKGNKGLLKSGSIQIMKAARGLIHSEIPQQINGLLFGFQLWINLPKANKMDDPSYQDIQPENIPIYDKDGIRVRVLAGKYLDIDGAGKDIIGNPLILDVQLQPGKNFTELIPTGHTAFAYVFGGKGKFGPKYNSTEVGVSQIAILETNEERDRIEVESIGEEPTRFLLIASAPINEPVAKYGPFVMNTQEEIEQAFDDFHNGRF